MWIVHAQILENQTWTWALHPWISSRPDGWMFALTLCAYFNWLRWFFIGGEGWIPTLGIDWFSLPGHHFTVLSHGTNLTGHHQIYKYTSLHFRSYRCQYTCVRLPSNYVDKDVSSVIIFFAWDISIYIFIKNILSKKYYERKIFFPALPCSSWAYYLLYVQEVLSIISDRLHEGVVILANNFWTYSKSW